MPDEKSKLQQEREELELEQLREEVGKRRAAKEMRKAAVAENEKSFADEAAKHREEQSRCNHKKGGKDYAALQHRGDGDNYAIFPWQHPRGYMIYLCSHCQFMWEPGVTQKTMSDGKTPNPTGVSYIEASKFPTDNSAAGSVMFGVRPQQVA
jgi:hypothetical protein